MLDNAFVIESFNSPNEHEYYVNATKKLGLWSSERAIFSKYVKPADSILDIGCGTGRVSFGLYDLGYRDITGSDLTPKMIEAARQIALEAHAKIPFYEISSTNLPFEDAWFDTVIYAFNGLMMIPGRQNRITALSEIFRIMKSKGLFIFTTHDRESKPEFSDFWKSEWRKWVTGTNDPRFDEFGDILFKNKDQLDQFIHIPSQEEIVSMLNAYGFDLLYKSFREDVIPESPMVKQFADECLFWVAVKR